MTNLHVQSRAGSPDSSWYYTHNNAQLGPVSFSQLRDFAASGRLDRFASMVWREGMASWQPANQTEGLFQGPPPPPLHSVASQGVNRPARSITVPKAGSVLPFVSCGLIATSFAALILAAILQSDGILFVYGVFTIAGGIVAIVWLHQAWSTVPPEYQSTTPGKAIGLLFVPFFNFYWIFRVYPELSKIFNKILDDKNCPQHVSAAAYGVGLAACIMALIPYLNLLSPILFVIWILLAHMQRENVIRALYG